MAKKAVADELNHYRLMAPRLTISAILGLLASPAMAAEDCKSDMDAFLHNPDQEHYQTVLNRKECFEAIFGSDDGTEDRIWHLVTGGNMYAARFIVVMMPDNAAAPAEEMLMMLGESIDKHPTLVLRLLAEKALTPQIFRNAITDTDREEDEHKTENERQKRLRAFRNVHDPALKDEQDLAIAIMRDKPFPAKYRPSN